MFCGCLLALYIMFSRFIVVDKISMVLMLFMNKLWCGYAMFCLSIPVLMEIWIIFNFGVMWDSPLSAVNILYCH